MKRQGRYPTFGDEDACLGFATRQIAAGEDAVEESKGEETGPQPTFHYDYDEAVFHNAVKFSDCSISPMSAFFGGIIAQEIVKYTGKYRPMKQWLHFDIYETLPKNEVKREPLGCRYDD